MEETNIIIVIHIWYINKNEYTYILILIVNEEIFILRN